MDAQLMFGYDELPNYSVRVSTRARRISLRYSTRDGLEVIVPARRRVPEGEIAELLHRGRAWIERTRLKLEQDRPPQSARIELPAEIRLPILDQTRTVEYRRTERAGVAVNWAGRRRIQLSGNIADRELCCRALQKALTELARDHLVAHLERLSIKTGLSYTKAIVRGQKTRWGSCSSSGTISLNYKLLLIDEPVARYVMIHELCHTMHLNHSKAFWRLVGLFDPDYKLHETELKRAARVMPGWVLPQ